MATLHENRLLFNSNVTVSHSGGNLSSDSGLILVKEFMDKFKFSRILRKNIQIQDDRLYHIHENESILEQIILQLIAGYPTDSSANILATDPIFQAVLNKKRLASQSSISRFWDRMTTENIIQLQIVQKIYPLKTYFIPIKIAVRWRTLLKKQRMDSILIKPIAQLFWKIMLI